MKVDEFNIVISGIGGQGVVTLANILEEAALLDGYEVMGSELHGLAMRFGPLECHVRFGKEIYSPLVARGKADIIFSLELLESLRVAHFANKETKFFVNKNQIKPTSVYFGNYKYPSFDEVKEKLEKISNNVFFNASEKVKSFGEVYSNVFLLGYAKNYLPLSEKSILGSIKKLPNFEINKKVYELGKENGKI
jgi:indolepyruvate ferredoxin oxidoreductase beta subunit